LKEEKIMTDPIVEEIRKIRDVYARRFNYDLHAMCVDLRHEQQRSGAPVVSFPRRPVRSIPHGGTTQPRHMSAESVS
jgi:hypothetical protein